ncbi:OmpP1/FadL family transporter [Desulfonema limicola]|nr:outer membrane protein transport protein [Desulfonema limicola]
MFSHVLLNPAFCENNMQRIEIPSSPNPVGSGARALGMGGAFIAIADDATAASWNPGGLIWLDQLEISVVGAAFHRIEDNSFRIYPDADGNQTVSQFNLNYLSAAFPFSFKDFNMVVSLNYQHLYDFTRKWDFSLKESGEEWYHQDVDYRSEGGLSAIGFAYCVQINKRISLGLTFNIWDDGISKNEWEQNTYQWGQGTDGKDKFVEEIRTFDKYTFSGYNFNFGLLWKRVNDSNLTIGAVIKTPFEADMEHEHSFHDISQYYELPSMFDQVSSDSFNENATLDMPLSYGIGFSYRFSDHFTASLDIYRTEWGDFVLTDSNGRETSPVSGKVITESDIDPTHQVRIGGEYLGFEASGYVFPVCFGAFYDPAPAEGSPDDFFGISIGSGITDGKRFTFDVAYQYRFGNDVGGSILKDWKFSQDVSEHTVYSSFIMYFK